MNPYVQDADFTLWNGDALDVLRAFPDESVDCAATSPPFYGLRDYGVDGQIGLEGLPEEWCARLVAVFSEVRRVLKPEGTLWIECGDSYASGGHNGKGFVDGGEQTALIGQKYPRPDWLKPKDLLGQPWLLAFALRADGWWLRQAIIWHKPNAMPESATDRCTTAHSYVFLLSKSARYWFDAEAISEPAEWARWGDQTVPKYEGTDTASGWMKPSKKPDGWDTSDGAHGSIHRNGREKGEPAVLPVKGTKNARSVWTIPTEGYPDAHFATWPQALVERILKAGCPEQVCAKCGKPRERIVQREQPPEPEHRNPGKRLEPGQAGNVGAGGMGFRASRLSGQEMNRWRAENPGTETWSDCGCGAGFTPGVVLDPFMGSGTTALVARKLGRRSIGIELNADYCELAARRLGQQSLLAEGTV